MLYVLQCYLLRTVPRSCAQRHRTTQAGGDPGTYLLQDQSWIQIRSLRLLSCWDLKNSKDEDSKETCCNTFNILNCPQWYLFLLYILPQQLCFSLCLEQNRIQDLLGFLLIQPTRYTRSPWQDIWATEVEKVQAFRSSFWHFPVTSSTILCAWESEPRFSHRLQSTGKPGFTILPVRLRWQGKDKSSSCLIPCLCLAVVNNIFLLCVGKIQSHILFFQEAFCSAEERHNKVRFVSL